MKEKNIYSQDYQESPAQGPAPGSGPESEEATSCSVGVNDVGLNFPGRVDPLLDVRHSCRTLEGEGVCGKGDGVIGAKTCSRALFGLLCAR